MSLKHKFFSILASAAVVGSVAVAISAQDPAPASSDNTPKAQKLERKGGFGRHGGFGRGMHRRGFRGMRGLMGIELTDAQKTQLKQIHEANRPDQGTLAELKAIREAKQAGTLTEDQKARVKALHAERRAKAESVHQQVLAILTPEQRQQIEDRKAEMRKRREEFRQRREQNRKPAASAPTKDPSVIQ